MNSANFMPYAITLKNTSNYKSNKSKGDKKAYRTKAMTPA